MATSKHVFRFVKEAKKIPYEYIGIIDNLNGTYDVYTCEERTGEVFYHKRNASEYEAYRVVCLWLGIRA